MRTAIRIGLLMVVYHVGWCVNAQPWIMWESSYGGSDNDEAVAWAAAGDTGYVVVAWSGSEDGDVSGHIGTLDYWIMRLDLEGNLVSEACFGGSAFDVPNAVRATPDGGCIVAGRTSSINGDVSGGHGGPEAWVVKFNESDQIEWQRCLGGSNTDIANDILLHPDGGYVVNGYTTSNNGDVSDNHGGGDMWVVRLDPEGDVMWQKCFGGSGYDEGRNIALMDDGGYLAIGRTNSTDGDVSGGNGDYDIWIVRLAPEGELVWQKCYGGSLWETNYALQILSAGDGSFVLATTTHSNDGDVVGHHGGMDGWVTKHDATGTMLWQRCLGGSENDQLRSVAECADGMLLISGFTASLDGDVQGNNGSEDAWLVKLDAQGDLMWQKCSGGTGADSAGDAAQLPDGGYLMVGHSSMANGDVSSSQGQIDAWIVRFGSELTTGVSAHVPAPEPATLSPNPTNGSLSVTVSGISDASDYTLCDLSGREVLRGSVSSFNGIDIGSLQVGTYVLLIGCNGQQRALRLVVS